MVPNPVADFPKKTRAQNGGYAHGRGDETCYKHQVLTLSQMADIESHDGDDGLGSHLDNHTGHKKPQQDVPIFHPTQDRFHGQGLTSLKRGKVFLDQKDGQDGQDR